MKWKAPSDRTQMILLSPIAIPLAIIVVPAIFALVGLAWLWENVLFPAHGWRPWFAWRPVRLDQWPTEWAWLERVEKRRIGNVGNIYRALAEQDIAA